MQPKLAALWYRRMSVVYAVGAWTVLGSVYLLNRKRKLAGRALRRHLPLDPLWYRWWGGFLWALNLTVILQSRQWPGQT